LFISARCNIYISRLCYDVSVRLSVRLSVMEVHWHIIANLGFKFRPTLLRIVAAVLLAGRSSSAMLASVLKMLVDRVSSCLAEMIVFSVSLWIMKELGSMSNSCGLHQEGCPIWATGLSCTAT